MRHLRNSLFAGAMIGGALLGSVASAETIAAEGYSPATSDSGLGLEIIAVDSIDGSQGSKLAFELKEALDGLRIGNEQWYRVVPVDSEPVDAIFQGSADTNSSITELDDKEVESCAEKDGDGKCVREKTTYYSCSRYEVSFYPDIELIGPDGAILYSVRDERTSEEDYCSDEDSKPSIRAMTNRLVSNFARRTRNALAPQFIRSDYRLLEKRKGLEKADRKLFKQALKLTKTDESAACEVFESLEANNPQQVSVLFNIGICHESDGDFELAKQFYQRSLDVESGKYLTRDAMRRIDLRMRGEAQLVRRSQILEQRYAEAEPPAPSVAAASDISDDE